MVFDKITKFSSIVFVVIAILNVSIPVVNANVQRIVGGSEAKESQYPFLVSIRRNDAHVCGGVIISENYILTAGRCVVKNFSNVGVVSYSPEDFNIRVGSLSLYEKGLLVRVSEVIVHANYSNMLNDLSLMKLQEPLIFSDYIKPISLPYETPSASSQITVAGWGFHKTAGDVSRNLQYLSMAVVDPSKCLAYIFGEEADQSLLCLQSTTGGICTGDIGGAAIYQNELVALASFTIERCNSEYPDGFTNIAYYAKWIRDNTDLK